jgi:hypothetical protein
MISENSTDALESLHRRLKFVESSRYRVDSFLSRLGLRHHPLLRDIPLFGASIAFDLVESLRNLRGLQHVGRVRLDGFSGSMRLPQLPHYRGYWYDPARNALVGMHLGLDLNFYQGKYYVLEANLGTAVKPARRALYHTPLDPFISATLETARTHGFKRIVFFNKRWPSHYVEEFKLATRQSGIECLGGSPAIRDPNPIYPMPGLPDPLQENTLYMMFPNLGTPIAHFVQNKERSASWLRETIDACPEELQALAYVPTFDELVIPTEPTDPRWPNLVVKLANKDRGRFVLMGRFRTREEALTALEMSAPSDVPGIFKIGLYERMKNRIFPRLEPIFQQFIPPQIVDGRACITRLHVFISPLVSEYLSAHCTTAGMPLPSRPEPGKVDTTGAYNVNYSVDGAYRTLPGEQEEVLRRAAREFGRVAQIAITRKFETGPSA